MDMLRQRRRSSHKCGRYTARMVPWPIDRGEGFKRQHQFFEAEQENYQKIPMRFVNKDTTGKLSGVPSVGTVADWGALEREEEVRGRGMTKKHMDQKVASPRAPWEALMLEAFHHFKAMFDGFFNTHMSVYRPPSFN